jgi:hypothetical protein
MKLPMVLDEIIVELSMRGRVFEFADTSQEILESDRGSFVASLGYQYCPRRIPNLNHFSSLIIIL